MKVTEIKQLSFIWGAQYIAQKYSLGLLQMAEIAKKLPCLVRIEVIALPFKFVIRSARGRLPP